MVTKAFQQDMKNKSQAFVGFLRVVKSEDVGGRFGEDPKSEVQKIKWEGLAASTWKECEEFAVVFPKDLPKVVPPRQMENEFKIDLEPDTTPIYQPIYKLSPLELQEAKTPIDSMLEHGFI